MNKKLFFILSFLTGLSGSCLYAQSLVYENATGNILEISYADNSRWASISTVTVVDMSTIDQGDYKTDKVLSDLFFDVNANRITLKPAPTITAQKNASQFKDDMVALYNLRMRLFIFNQVARETPSQTLINGIALSTPAIVNQIQTIYQKYP